MRQDDRPTSRGPDDVGPGELAKRSIALPGGRVAIAVFAPATVSGEEAAEALALPRARGVIVLNGGTADLAPDLRRTLRRTLGDGLARVAIEKELTVVTGGTDAGIFALFGEALADNRTAPCVGVVPSRFVDDEVVSLEPHHSHFLIVEGDEWGDETDAMLGLSEALSAHAPSLAILAGGGGGARREVLAHLRGGREVIVLKGTGRFAERLVAAVGGDERGEETAEMVASGRITVVDVAQPPSVLADLVRNRLTREETQAP